MLVDQPKAPPKWDRRLPAFAVGGILLAAVPAILSAFDEMIDDSLHLSELWPEFWTLLDQIEPWWGGGIVAVVILIGGRALVNRLRNYVALYLVGVVVWWLALAVAPAFLVYFAINRGPGHPALRSGLRNLLFLEVTPAWFVGTLLLAVLLGGRKLRDRSNMMSYLVGTVLCGLTLAFGPLFMAIVIDTALMDLNHRIFGLFDWFAPLWMLWILLLISFAAFEWSSKLSHGWGRSASLED
jgi:hypothetical protein